MNALGHEVRLTQNPALGAVLLWRFSAVYAASHPQHAPAPLPLLFLTLPAVWHEPTAAHIASTLARSGLRAFAAKFSEARPPQLDVLLDLHERSRRCRAKTLESLRVAFAMSLVRMGPEATIIAGDLAWSPDAYPRRVKALCSAAEKLAGWCAPLTLHEISLALHVRF
jgi:hypothetical protein